jgi:tripartite-type tricarboxylate transporter receptor subunit TctC
VPPYTDRATDPKVMNEPMHQPPQRDRARLAAALVALWAAPAMARDAAAAYPSRPIRIVVGFTPGGPADQVAREVGQRLQDAWGQPVIVENRPGAGSRIAFEQVARAAPDGYTLLLGAVQTATHMAVYRKLNFDTLRDFAPARARPDELSYASFGIASSAHFAGALFEQRAGLRLTHVPYQGATQAQTAIAGGQVDLGFMSALSAMPLMQAGKLRPLAVTSEQRLAQLPGVPTMAEAGFPAFEVSSWQGLLAPAATPPAIVAKLQREIARILALPEVRQRFAAVAAEPVASTPAQFRAHIESEIARWSTVARQAGVSLD